MHFLNLISRPPQEILIYSIYAVKDLIGKDRVLHDIARNGQGGGLNKNQPTSHGQQIGLPTRKIFLHSVKHEIIVMPAGSRMLQGKAQILTKVGR